MERFLRPTQIHQTGTDHRETEMSQLYLPLEIYHYDGLSRFPAPAVRQGDYSYLILLETVGKSNFSW